MHIRSPSHDDLVCEGLVAFSYDLANRLTVGRLREKLERDPASPRLIETVRGAGYRFAKP